MKQLTKFIIMTLLLVSASYAQAVTVSLSPVSQTIQAGNLLNIDVFYDTQEASTVGGAFSVTFDDTAFGFVSAEFDTNLPDDPFFRESPTSVTGDSFDLSFGKFPGINGSGRAILLVFEAKQEVGLFNFMLSNSITRDPFQEGVSYDNAQVQVNAVPIPGAIWLFLSAFVGMRFVPQQKGIS